MKLKYVIGAVILAAAAVLLFMTQIRGAADSMDSAPFDRLDKQLFAETEENFSEDGRKAMKVPSPDGSWRGLCIDEAGHFYSVCKADGTVRKLVQRTGEDSEVFWMGGRIFGFCVMGNTLYFQQGDRDRKAARFAKLLGKKDYGSYMMNIEYWQYSFEDNVLQQISKREYVKAFEPWRDRMEG